MIYKMVDIWDFKHWSSSMDNAGSVTRYKEPTRGCRRVKQMNIDKDLQSDLDIRHLINDSWLSKQQKSPNRRPTSNSWVDTRNMITEDCNTRPWLVIHCLFGGSMIENILITSICSFNLYCLKSLLSRYVHYDLALLILFLCCVWVKVYAMVNSYPVRIPYF